MFSGLPVQVFNSIMFHRSFENEFTAVNKYTLCPKKMKIKSIKNNL